MAAAIFAAAILFSELAVNRGISTLKELPNSGALRMLTQFEDPALLQRSLDYALSGKVRNQDSIIQFAFALQSDENRDQTWKYIQDNWEKVQTQLTPEMGAYLVRSTGDFCSADARASVEKFFAAHKVPSADQYLKHALESIDGCIELRKLQEPKLKQWLAAHAKQ